MSKIRKSAKGQNCDLQIHPWCNSNPETVVLCHLPSEGKGMAIKSPDWFAVYGCSSCHDIIDGRRSVDIPKSEITACMMRGLFRTHQKLIDQGLMVIK